MKKFLLLAALVNFCFVSFGQYGSTSNNDDLFLIQLIAGAIGLSVVITIWAIAARMLQLKESIKTLIKIQTMQGIASGVLLSKTCANCNKPYAVDLVVNKNICPSCGAKQTVK